MHDAIRADLGRAPAERALLVHLGDYVDRGPDSAGCVALLAAGPPIDGVATINLVGNHEQMLLDALAEPSRAMLWLQNGGVATLQSWGLSPDEAPSHWAARIPAAHLEFLRNLPLTHRAGRFLFVHAGVRPGIRLAMQSPQDLLWVREAFLEWDGTMLPDAPELIIVHGHTPMTAPEVRRNRISIDTNAGRGGPLTCAALSADSVYFLQV